MIDVHILGDYTPKESFGAIEKLIFHCCMFLDGVQGQERCCKYE